MQQLPPQAKKGDLVVLDGETWNKIRDHLYDQVGEENQIDIGVRGDGTRVFQFASEKVDYRNENGVLVAYFVPMRRSV